MKKNCCLWHEPRKSGELPFYLLGTAAAPDEAGAAVVYGDAEMMTFEGRFEDADVFNHAVRNNEKLWRTGDVMELFLQPDHRSEVYYEFHLTPDGITLQLHFDSVPTAFELASHLCQTNMEAEATRTEIGWNGKFRIRAADFGITDWNLVRFAVCRYNYTTGREAPEISSSEIFMSGGFHQPKLWRQVLC